MFNIGKAEAVKLRSYMNIFPADAAEISKIILAGHYDLTSVNRQDEQGFLPWAICCMAWRLPIPILWLFIQARTAANIKNT